MIEESKGASLSSERQQQQQTLLLKSPDHNQEVSNQVEAQFENAAIVDAGDSSEDEEFYRRQIMEFDIFKYDEKLADKN